MNVKDFSLSGNRRKRYLLFLSFEALAYLLGISVKEKKERNMVNYTLHLLGFEGLPFFFFFFF